MTWILGQASIFDYGAMISDVRVTWGGGQHADVLQKIHPVGHLMLVGFAGSVELGFAMVNDMQQLFQGPAGHVWFPRAASWIWWRRGRRIFASAPPHLRRLGCSLILVGVSAVPSGFLRTRSYAVRMSAPAFTPQFSRQGEWLSIGAGATHSVARELAEAYEKNPFDFLQVEQAGFGATIWSIAAHITERLLQTPHHSVSEASLIGIVSARGFLLQGHSLTTDFGTSIAHKVETPPLLATWNDFVHYSRQNGLEAAAAYASTLIELAGT
jgi:hypothetical protein